MPPRTPLGDDIGCDRRARGARVTNRGILRNRACVAWRRRWRDQDTGFDMSYRALLWCIVVWCHLIVAPALKAQSTVPAIAQFQHSSWTVRDGAATTVLALAQSPDGFLWVGTTTGLYRFDGARFEEFEPPTGETLLSRSIATILALPDSVLWIGYSLGGATRLKGNAVQHYGDREGLPSGTINAFARDSVGVLWVATTSGLAHLVDRRWEVAGAREGFPGGMTTDITVDRRGTLWAAQHTGVFTRARGTGRFVRVGPSLDSPTGGAGMLREAPDGSVWGASMTLGLTRLNDESGRPPHGAGYPAKDRGSYGLIIDHAGNAWVMGMYGLVRTALPTLAGQGATQVLSTRQHPLATGVTAAGTAVTALLEDREGSVWVGTERGLDRLRLARVGSVPTPKRLFKPAIAADTGSLLWVGSTFNPLFVVGDATAQPRLPAGIQCAYRDLEGNIWMAGPPGLWESRGGAFRSVALPKEAIHGDVQAFARSADGDLWLSVRTTTIRGVFRRRGDRWERFVSPANAREQIATVITTDSAGRTWLGFPDERVVRIKGESLAVMSAAEGLRVGSVTAIQVHGDHVWVGGPGGLMFFDGARFRPLTPVGGSIRGITGIVETASGELWLNGADGITRLAMAEVRRAMREPGYRAVDERLNHLDGLDGSAPQMRPFPSAVEGSHGRLWFTTESSVAWIDPAHIHRNLLPPPVQLNSVEAAGRSYKTDHAVTLPAHTSDLHVSYTALSLAIPERVRFRYQLIGSDTGWREAGTRREAFYTNLGPGTYRFRVIAANEDGVWNNVGASVDVNVPPAFVQTTGFRALCWGLGAGTMWLIMLWRQRRLATVIRARFDATLEERTRIAQELHDTLLQGFIGVTMQIQAAHKLLPGRPDAAAEMLAGTAATAKATLVDARQVVSEMRVPELDARDLTDALRIAASDAIGSAPIEFRLVVHGKRRRLPHTIEVVAFRIGREAVVNAVRHAQATTVELVLTFGAQALGLTITDDGHGIAPAAIANARRNGHWGIAGMQERAASIGGTVEISGGTSGGGVVAVLLPLASDAAAVSFGGLRAASNYAS